MGHTPDQHVEHAEHNEHHAQDPFNRRVAMTIAIVAAVLAGVTLLSHRGHTETLRLQAEANIVHTEKTSQWNLYQAKNVRSYLLQGLLTQSDLIPPVPETKSAREKARDAWKKQVERYEGVRGADGQRNRDAGELATLMAKARELEDKAKGLEAESHHVHAAVNWIDYGHLAIELALVLCSVAVLTRQRFFWISGGVVAVLGAGLAATGIYRWMFLVPHPH
jgi:hypothetical protein